MQAPACELRCQSWLSLPVLSAHHQWYPQLHSTLQPTNTTSELQSQFHTVICCMPNCPNFEASCRSTQIWRPWLRSGHLELGAAMLPSIAALPSHRSVGKHFFPASEAFVTDIKWYVQQCIFKQPACGPFTNPMCLCPTTIACSIMSQDISNPLL